MFRSRNQVVLPLEIEKFIPQNDPVFKLVEICEKLDYSKLKKEYVRSWRKLDPATMFIILVYAYMRRLYSSRQIEEACKTDIRFMWILGMEEAPDHSTIARFQNEKLVPVIEDLFYQLINQLIDMDEVSYTNVFVDGTKIEANANKYSFVWAKAVEKNLKKLEAKMEIQTRQTAVRYCLKEEISFEELLCSLMQLASLQNISFVYGKGKRKTQLQRDIDLLVSMGDKRHGYLESLKISGKRKSYSKTDTDATFMRMKEDYMKNGQLKPGYNVQIAVESEYIVGLGLFHNPTDTTTLIPFMERMKSRSNRQIKNLIADAGYASEEIFTYLEQNEQNAYIKPQNYEMSKTRKYKRDKYRPEHMKYDSKTDEYICPNNKKLTYLYTSRYTTDNGYVTSRKVYQCESCENCPYRNECHTSKYDRRIRVSHKLNEQNRKATELITTEKGILLRMNRSIQVEGAFGVIKQDFRFRRFLTRGKAKTETQFFLISFAYNVEKLCNRINSNRFGHSLFEKMIA